MPMSPNGENNNLISNYSTLESVNIFESLEKETIMCNSNIDQIIKTYSDNSKYLLKPDSIEKVKEFDLSNQYIIDFIKKENQEFLQENSSETITQYFEKLNDKQKDLVKHLGSQYFSKTLNPKMCNLISRQMMNYKEAIFGKTRGMYYIPMFIPAIYNSEIYNITQNVDSAENVISILQQLPYVKIKYVIANIIERDTKTQKRNNRSEKVKYLIVCADKLEYVNVPEIYVFIHSSFLNEKMELVDTLKTKSIRCMFYDNIKQYEDFLYGCVVLDINSDLNKGKMYKDPFKRFSCLNADFKDVYEEFQDLERKVKNKIKSYMVKTCDEINKQQIEFRHKQKEPESVASLKRKFEQTEQEKELNEPEEFNESELTKKQITTFSSNNTKMYKKYKEEVEKGVYNIEKLIKSSIFHESSNIYYTNNKQIGFNINAIENIKNNIEKHINIMHLNKNNNVFETSNAIVLVPIQYKINKNDTEYEIKEKQIMLRKALIEQPNYVYAGITLESEYEERFNDAKVIAAFTKEILPENMENNKILILLPKSFSVNGQPLYDPNNLAANTFFYESVESKKASYPLYVFKINVKFDYKSINNNLLIYKYAKHVININDHSLADYIINAYALFQERIREQVELLQESV